MKQQKTIRIGDYQSYRFTADDEALECYGYDYTDDDYNPVYNWQPTKYRLGAKCVLVSSCNVSPNAIREGRSTDYYYLIFDTKGVGGNSNSDIRRYHGWRGTTQDISRTAHGLREIVKISITKRGYVTVTVGPDLHPEWD